MLQKFRFCPSIGQENFQPGTASPLSVTAFQTDLKDPNSAPENFEMPVFWWKTCLLYHILKHILEILP